MRRPSICDDWLPLIDAACDGDIAALDRARLEAHVAACAACAAEWRSLAAVAPQLREGSPAPAPSPVLTERVRLVARNAVSVGVPFDSATAPRSPHSGRTVSRVRLWAVAAAALIAVLGAVRFTGSPSPYPSGPEPGRRVPSTAHAGDGNDGNLPLPPPSVVDGGSAARGSSTSGAADGAASLAVTPPGETRVVPATRTVEVVFAELCSANDPLRQRRLMFEMLQDRSRAVPYLLAVLSGPDDARRLPAIEVLGEAKDPRASRPLARLLDDPACASSALRALGSIGDPVARVACLRALRRDDLRDDAIRALSRCADASLAEPLVRAVAEGVITPASAAEVTRKVPSAEGRNPLLAELRSTDPGRRDAAAAILVECRDPAVRPFLEASFRDRDGRGWAATQLARLADPACVPALLDAAREPAAEEDVLHVLRAIGGPAVAALAPFLRQGDRPVQRRAIRLLARLGDASATPALLDAAADPELRSSAVAALIECGDQRAAPFFLSVVSDRRLAPEVIAALGAMREVSAIPVLIPALRRREVREEALEALRQITREDFGLDAARWARWWKSRSEEARNPPGVVVSLSSAKLSLTTPRGGVSVVLERSRS